MDVFDIFSELNNPNTITNSDFQILKNISSTVKSINDQGEFFDSLVREVLQNPSVFSTHKLQLHINQYKSRRVIKAYLHTSDWKITAEIHDKLYRQYTKFRGWTRLVNGLLGDTIDDTQLLQEVLACDTLFNTFKRFENSDCVTVNGRIVPVTLSQIITIIEYVDQEHEQWHTLNNIATFIKIRKQHAFVFEFLKAMYGNKFAIEDKRDLTSTIIW